MTTPIENDTFDPRQDLSGVPRTGGKLLPRHALHIEIVENVAPLGPQLGVYPAQTVPEALRDVLFGQPMPDEMEINAAGGDSDALASMQTYAVLDAGKVPGLIERLAGSDLQHRCLFKGSASGDFGHIAPWLVRLEDGNALTRSLFSITGMPSDLWEVEPGILIRSRAPLDEVWGHLRKFTRVQDVEGKWFYFRFWEGWYFHVLADRQNTLPELSRLFARILHGAHVVVPHRHAGAAVLARPARRQSQERFVLTPALRAELSLATLYRNMMASAFDLYELHPEEVRRYGESPKDMWPLLYDFADEVRGAGLKDPQLRARMMLLAFISYPEPWPAFVEAPFWQKIKRSGKAETMFEDFCCRLKYQNIRNGRPESVWW